MTSEEINVLGNIFNTNWGRSANQGTPTVSVNASISGDQVIVKYVSVIRLVDIYQNRAIIEAEKSTAQEVLNNFVASTKKKYKKVLNKSLKMTSVEDPQHSVEPIGFRPQGVPTDSIFRMTAVYDIG